MSIEKRIEKIDREVEEIKSQNPSDLVLLEIRVLQAEIANLKNHVSAQDSRLDQVESACESNEAADTRLYDYLTRLEAKLNRMATEASAFLGKVAKGETSNTKYSLADALEILDGLKKRVSEPEYEGYLETFSANVDPEQVSQIASNLRFNPVTIEEIARFRERIEEQSQEGY